MMFVLFTSNTMGVRSGAGTANPSEAPEFTSSFSEVRVDRSVFFVLSFVNQCLSWFGQCIILCSSMAIALSILLPFSASNYLFGISTLFLFPTHYICSNMILCCLIYLVKNEYRHLVLGFLFFNTNVRG